MNVSVLRHCHEAKLGCAQAFRKQNHRQAGNLSIKADQNGRRLQKVQWERAFECGEILEQTFQLATGMPVQRNVCKPINQRYALFNVDEFVCVNRSVSVCDAQDVHARVELAYIYFSGVSRS